MNFESSFEEISEVPPIYNLKLSIIEKNGDSKMEFNQQIIFNSGESGFHELIEAINTNKNLKIIYTMYGIPTEYIIIDNKFIINRSMLSGNTTLIFDLKKDYEFIKMHMKNMQDCLDKCNVKSLDDNVKEFIKANQQVSFSLMYLQNQTMHLINQMQKK
jgi:hypothetical protein